MLTESAKVPVTWVRSNTDRFAAPGASFGRRDCACTSARRRTVHKRPSAGVTLAVAVVSALTGQLVRGDVALTGELTLAGMVEPVAGVREKVLAACRARMTAVLLPAANAADVAETFGEALPCAITVHYARTMDDVLEVVLPRRRGVARGGAARPTRAPAGEAGDSVFPGPGSRSEARPGVRGAASRLPANVGRTVRVAVASMNHDSEGGPRTWTRST